MLLLRAIKYYCRCLENRLVNLVCVYACFDGLTIVTQEDTRCILVQARGPTSSSSILCIPEHERSSVCSRGLQTGCGCMFLQHMAKRSDPYSKALCPLL